jgi:hypothetical protein
MKEVEKNLESTTPGHSTPANHLDQADPDKEE